MSSYSVLEKPRAIQFFYENDKFIVVTKESTGRLHRNRTIDWQKRDFY